MTPGALDHHVVRSFIAESHGIDTADSRGHMGVEGLVGMRTWDAEASMRFSVMAFPPEQLVELKNGALALSRELAGGAT